MRADNTPAGLSVLAECTTDIRQWYLQNGLQLNPDKSEALIVRITNQLRAVTSSVSSMSVAGVDMPVADDIKVPATPNPGSRTRPQPTIDHYGAVSTFHDDNICETRFLMLYTSCLELTTENCSQ